MCRLVAQCGVLLPHPFTGSPAPCPVSRSTTTAGPVKDEQGVGGHPGSVPRKDWGTGCGARREGTQGKAGSRRSQGVGEGVCAEGVTSFPGGITLWSPGAWAGNKSKRSEPHLLSQHPNWGMVSRGWALGSFSVQPTAIPKPVKGSKAWAGCSLLQGRRSPASAGRGSAGRCRLSKLRVRM